RRSTAQCLVWRDEAIYAGVAGEGLTVATFSTGKAPARSAVGGRTNADSGRRPIPDDGTCPGDETGQQAQDRAPIAIDGPRFGQAVEPCRIHGKLPSRDVAVSS